MFVGRFIFGLANLKNSKFLLVFLSLIVLSSCSKQEAQLSTGIIDLDKIAVAMGQDKLIGSRIVEFSKAEEVKLTSLRNDLIAQVNTVKSQLTDEATNEEKTAVIKLAKQGDLQLNQEIFKAKGMVGQLKIQLVLEFKNKVEPIARQVANERGMQLIAIKTANYLYIDPKADITDAVIDKLLALKAEKVESDKSE